MASTNKTTHLRLNQWIGTDPVLRTDFNFDNSRIDAAVNARALIRLTGTTLTAGAASIALDLLDYDLTQYAALQLYLSPVASGEAAVTLQVNETTPVELAAMAADGSRGLVIHLCLLPGGIGGWWFAPGATGTASGSFRISGVTAGDLATLTLACAGSVTFQKGTGCSLYGVKK